MDNFMMAVTLTTVSAFVIGAIFGPILIPVLTKLKFGQEIREIGPNWHKKKTGTPTMGGIIFIIAVIISSLIFSRGKETYLILVTALAFGIIGFIDDFIKIVFKRNLGLTSKQKLLLQIVVSALFIVLGLHFEFFDTNIILPFNQNTYDLGILFVVLAFFVMVGGVNSVNLTDGLDGLAASVTAVVSVFFTVAAYVYYELPVAVFCAALTGGCMAFLLFNSYPAKVFMGDTGSLFLGGGICAAAIMLKMPIILFIAGGVYVIETLSVIIQVTVFKLTKKRVFKMSPIHHHFEMVGFSERQIVIGAIIITFLLCAFSFVMLRFNF